MAALFQPMDPPYRRTDVFVISSIVYQENPIGIESILTISVEPSSNAKGVIYVPRNSLKDGNGRSFRSASLVLIFGYLNFRALKYSVGDVGTEARSRGKEAQLDPF